MKKRTLALILAVLLLASCLAGCSSGKSSETIEDFDDERPVVQKSEKEASQLTSKYAYKAEYIPIPGDFDWINASALGGGKLYFTASVKDGQETYTDDLTGEEYSYDNFRDGLFVMDIETRELRELSDLPTAEIPEGWEGNSSIGSICVAEDGTLWALSSAYTYRYNLPEDFDEETQYEWDYYEEGAYITSLIHVDADGSVLNQIDLNSERNEEGYYSSVSSFKVDQAGNVYTYDWETIRVYGADGALIAEQPSSSSYSGDLVKLSADQVGLSVYEYDEQSQTSSQYFVPLDPTTGAWGEKTKLPSNAWSFFPGDDVYDLYYEYNGNIYGWKRDGDVREKVVDWMECDVNSNNLSGYEILPDGRIAGILRSNRAFVYTGSSSASSESDTQNPMELVILTRVDASSIPEKKILTLACYYLDYDLRTHIIDFNKNSDTCRIVVKDYSEYATDDDYDAGILKLNTEILSGVIPDIMLTGSFPVERYIAKGVFTDLYELIDSDAELSRDDFVPEVLSAAETDGKLYQIPVSFNIDTAVALRKVVEEYETWDVAALKDAMSKLQEGASIFGRYADRSTASYYLLERNIQAFVDWSSQSCRFDSPEFISILELIAQFPETIDYEALEEEGVYVSDQELLNTGMQLLAPTGIYSIDSIAHQTRGYGDVLFIGYPSEDGTTRSTFGLNCAMAISSACENKDEAWGFVRQMLLPEYQGRDEMSWSLPINRKVLDQRLEEAMQVEYWTDENGEKVDWDGDGEYDLMEKGGYWGVNPETGEEEYIPIYALEQSDVDTFRSLLESTGRISSYDNAIVEIINDEAAAFYAGQKTAEDTVKLIQSRVGLYIAEQS